MRTLIISGIGLLSFPALAAEPEQLALAYVQRMGFMTDRQLNCSVFRVEGQVGDEVFVGATETFAPGCQGWRVLTVKVNVKTGVARLTTR